MARSKKQTIDGHNMEARTQNVVVFGESGVGKSSLINLIAGRKVCETSSGALGCTLEYTRHLLSLDNQQFAIWDTAGLDEGTQGSVPAEKAEAYLKQLLHELAKSNGVDLLVYCVRGTRVRSALLTNYHIFYSAICRKKVPIAIVITGLENQEGSMETWWHANDSQFSSLKMLFSGHACVTTLESCNENTTLMERRRISKESVTKMIISTCRTQPWKPLERSWIESAYADIRAMLSPKDGRARLATIIMCEAYRSCQDSQLTRKPAISFHKPITFSLSLSSLNFRSPVSISVDTSRSKLPFEHGVKCTPERLYRVYQVPTKDMEEGTKKAIAVKRGADLLVFCVKMEEIGSKSIKSQWEHFNFTYGGDLSPRIVVVVGAPDRSAAEKWWKDTVGETLTKDDVCVAPLPESATDTKISEAILQLQHLMNDCRIDCNKVTFTRNEELFRRSLYLDMTALVSLWAKQEVIGGEDRESASEQDILTQLGIWYEVPDPSPSPTLLVSPRRSQGHFF